MAAWRAKHALSEEVDNLCAVRALTLQNTPVLSARFQYAISVSTKAAARTSIFRCGVFGSRTQQKHTKKANTYQLSPSCHNVIQYSLDVPFSARENNRSILRRQTLISCRLLVTM